MTIRFPFSIEQIDSTTVKVRAGDGPILDMDFVHTLKQWGLSEVVVDEAVREFLQKLIAASIKIQ